MADILLVLPFGNQVERIEVTGQTLLDALTHSVARFIPGLSGSGRFLQMSGIQQVYPVWFSFCLNCEYCEFSYTQCPMTETEAQTQAKNELNRKHFSSLKKYLCTVFFTLVPSVAAPKFER